MSISMQEFQFVMEAFGAKRLKDWVNPETGVVAPRFEVEGTRFYHSGSYYVAWAGRGVSWDEIGKVYEVLKKHEESQSFDYAKNQVYSFKGLLVLVSILEKKYTKELVDNLISEMYKKLFENPLLKKKPTNTSLKEQPLPKIRKLLSEFDELANPFNGHLKLKDPISYMDRIKITTSMGYSNDKAEISLSSERFRTNFMTEPDHVLYSIKIWNDPEKGKESGITDILHHYNKDPNGKIKREIVCLRYTTGKGEYCRLPGSLCFEIDMMTGETYNVGEKEKALFVTDEQAKIICAHLRKVVKRTQKEIAKYMILNT